MNPARTLLRRVRAWVAVLIVGLAVSGLTAIPLEWELNTAVRILGLDKPSSSLAGTGAGQWLIRVRDGLSDTTARHPFMAYGTDWLAFGHLAIALVFVGAWREPVRNRWLFDFGLIALLVPYALALGGWRGIPLGWRLIDCSFGIGGAIPLWLARRDTLKLEQLTATETPS